MRTIDADALMREVEKAEKSMERHGREFSCSFLSSSQEISTEWYFVEQLIDDAPTIEPTLYGYKFEQLAFVAALLQNKGVTEENLADVLNCVDWVVGLVLEHMKEKVIQSVMTGSVKETDEVTP